MPGKACALIPSAMHKVENPHTYLAFTVRCNALVFVRIIIIIIIIRQQGLQISTNFSVKIEHLEVYIFPQYW